MKTELMLVEGVSDVLLISYYLQNVYGWRHEAGNDLGITPFDDYEHIESLSKNENQLVLCGVGGNGKFTHFIEQHRVNEMIVERDISSLLVVTDRDETSVGGIVRRINDAFEGINIRAGEWRTNSVTDSFGQPKYIDTYLLIIPENEKGALEKVIIDTLKDIPEETNLIQEVVRFIETLKPELVPALKKISSANKATVGTFFSVRNPKNAMRSFGVYISQIDWAKSESLRKLFLPFKYLERGDRMDRDSALKIAKNYCKDRGLSYKKLLSQKVFIFDDMVHFVQPIDYPSSDGLRTDKLTQPLPTLIYHIETNEFEETEYTEKYLML